MKNPDHKTNPFEAVIKRYLDQRAMTDQLFATSYAKPGKTIPQCCNFIIAVFQTVADIAREGAHMHHCVFSAGYHRRKNTLLLSAADKTGKHIETIEVDLDHFTVAQSRGKCNSNTVHHDRILRLCKKHMHLIRQAAV